MKPKDIKWIAIQVQEIVSRAAAARTAGEAQYYQPLVTSNFPDQDVLQNLQSGVSAELKNQGFAASHWAALEPGIFSIIVPFNSEAKTNAQRAGYAFPETDGIAPPQ